MGDSIEQKCIDVDMRGQVCPACLLVAMDIMNKNREVLKSGSVTLSIKTDNREATTTIPTTAKNMGYKVEVCKKDTYYQISVGMFLRESKI